MSLVVSIKKNRLEDVAGYERALQQAIATITEHEASSAHTSLASRLIVTTSDGLPLFELSMRLSTADGVPALSA